MNIYKKRPPAKVYRDIYIKHHGSIPVDEENRSYDIHHIDGNPFNNDIDNLIALSIYEHYEIHYWQNDWGGCYAISRRMAVTVDERIELGKKYNKKRVENGTHPWQKRVDGSSATSDRVKNGTHPPMSLRGKNHHSHNSTVFIFKNDDGRTHTCTSYDLRMMYPDICKKQLSSVIHNNKKSVKGWRILT